MRKRTWEILSAANVVAGGATLAAMAAYSYGATTAGATAAAGAGAAGTIAAAAIGGFLRNAKQKGPGEIFSTPGATAVRVLQFLVPKKAYDEVFAQTIADTREEYFAALDEGDKAKAGWIRVRDGTNLWVVLLLYLIAACLDRGIKIYKAFGSK